MHWMIWHFYQPSKCKNYIESLKYTCIRLTQVIKSKLIQSIRMSLLDSQSTSTFYLCLCGTEYSKSSCRYSFVNSHMCIGWNLVSTYPLGYRHKSYCFRNLLILINETKVISRKAYLRVNLQTIWKWKT